MRSRWRNPELAFKVFAKELIWFSLNRHKPSGEKNICIFSSRRGGSTLLMEVIAANAGVRFMNQPLSVAATSPAQLGVMPIFDSGQLIHLDRDEEQAVSAYLESIFTGKLTVNGPWKFWQSDVDFTSERLVLKIADANALIDWFDKNFPIHVVYLTRHPIPQALSVIRNGWGLTAKAYLRNNFFVSNFLNDDQVAFCWDILANGSLLQQHVLNWALENLVPFRMLPQRPHWLRISYEELVLCPDRIVGELAKALNLGEIDAMTRKLQLPSRSTKGQSTEETRGKIVTGDVDYLSGRWKRSVSDEEERASFEVLEVLGINMYRYGSLLPTCSEVADGSSAASPHSVPAKAR